MKLIKTKGLSKVGKVSGIGTSPMYRYGQAEDMSGYCLWFMPYAITFSYGAIK